MPRDDATRSHLFTFQSPSISRDSKWLTVIAMTSWSPGNLFDYLSRISERVLRHDHQVWYRYMWLRATWHYVPGKLSLSAGELTASEFDIGRLDQLPQRSLLHSMEREPRRYDAPKQQTNYRITKTSINSNRKWKHAYTAPAILLYLNDSRDFAFPDTRPDTPFATSTICNQSTNSSNQSHSNYN